MAENEPTLAERAKALRGLLAEYGGAELIPESKLGEVSYVRIEQEGVLRILPAEKLASVALADALKREKQAALSEKLPPFRELTFATEVEAGFHTTLRPDAIEQRLVEVLETFDTDYMEDNLSIRWLAKDDPANYVFLELKDKFSSDHRVGAEIEGRRVYVSPREPDFYLDTTNSLAHYAVETIADKLSEMTFHGRLPNKQDAEHIWESLERFKSQATDVELLELEFENMFSQLAALDEDGTELKDEAGDDLDYCGVGPGMQVYADYLEQKGFTGTAGRLREVHTIPEARILLDEALQQNEVTNEWKKADKELAEKRKALTDQEAIFENNAMRSELKKAHRQTMRSLRGVHTLMNTPEVFSRLLKSHISEFQKNFLTSLANKEVVDITLDCKPDSEKDKDPGRLSGDCTAGEPLPFGPENGLYNVKVNVGAEHKGNVYLLETVMGKKQRTKAWHLEAIQVPTAAVDWDDFVPKFVDKLAAAAKEAGIEAITLNVAPHHISNYDYIANAFLRYMGVEDAAYKYEVEYGLGGRFDPSSYSSADIKYTRVKFPPHSSDEGTSDFQGKSDRQMVLWRAKSPKSERPA